MPQLHEGHVAGMRAQRWLRGPARHHSVGAPNQERVLSTCDLQLRWTLGGRHRWAERGAGKRCLQPTKGVHIIVPRVRRAPTR